MRVPSYHLAEDEAGFNRLAKADFISKQEPLFGGTQELQQRLELVGLEFRTSCP